MRPPATTPRPRSRSTPTWSPTRYWPRTTRPASRPGPRPPRSARRRSGSPSGCGRPDVRALRALVALVLLGACAAGPGNAWAEVSLPGSGPLRDAIACGGDWYVVGGRPGAAGPAAWRSSDGRAWRRLTLVALPGSYYGPRSVLYS